MCRRVISLCCAALILSACGERLDAPESHVDDAGFDAGVEATDAGSAYVPPLIKRERSLFWTQPEIVDEVTFGSVLARIASDGHGGRLLDAWFRRFATTAHSERAQPAQLMDEVAASQGADPSTWQLGSLPFKVTGIHNRI